MLEGELLMFLMGEVGSELVQHYAKFAALGVL